MKCKDFMLYDLMKPNKKILTLLMLLTFLINKLSFFLIIAWWKVQHKHYALLQDKTKLFVLKKDFYHNSHVWSTDICSKMTWHYYNRLFTMTLFKNKSNSGLTPVIYIVWNNSVYVIRINKYGLWKAKQSNRQF